MILQDNSRSVIPFAGISGHTDTFHAIQAREVFSILQSFAATEFFAGPVVHVASLILQVQPMALVSLTDAAKLVRKSRATLARDIARGHLRQTVLQDGDARIDTAELARIYGQTTPPKKPERSAGERQKIARLEERVKALERVVALEAELRRAKDQVTQELRARLADKDNFIKLLESKVTLLEYDRQVQAIPTLDPADRIAPASQPPAAADLLAPSKKTGGWWARLFKPAR